VPVLGVELWRERGAGLIACAKNRSAIARPIDQLRQLQVPCPLAESGG
jgi:hypothetical protein